MSPSACPQRGGRGRVGQVSSNRIGVPGPTGMADYPNVARAQAKRAGAEGGGSTMTGAGTGGGGSDEDDDAMDEAMDEEDDFDVSDFDKVMDARAAALGQREREARAARGARASVERKCRRLGLAGMAT